MTEQTKGYTGDHTSWQGEPCKECGKNHPSWVHKPKTPVQAARQMMVKQMRSTAYVFANPKKYDKTRQAESVARLELRMAEYDVAIADRTISRLERLEIRRAKQEIVKAKEKLASTKEEVNE